MTRYGFDGRGNRVSRTDAAGGNEAWSYDLADRLVSATDQLGRATTYAYDIAGRLAEITDPSGRIETRSYDGAGRLPAGHGPTAVRSPSPTTPSVDGWRWWTPAGSPVTAMTRWVTCSRWSAPTGSVSDIPTTVLVGGRRSRTRTGRRQR